MQLSRWTRVTRSVVSAPLIALLAVLASMVVASPAHAGDVNPNSVICDTGYTYKTSLSANNYHIGVGITYKSGPGGTVTASLQYSLSVSATISSSVTVEGGVLIADAKTQLGLSVTATASISQTYTYSHAVSATKYGNLRFGNWGYKISFTKYHVSSTCSETAVGSGSAILPSVSTWGYRYWETSS